MSSVSSQEYGSLSAENEAAVQRFISSGGGTYFLISLCMTEQEMLLSQTFVRRHLSRRHREFAASLYHKGILNPDGPHRAALSILGEQVLAMLRVMYPDRATLHVAGSGHRPLSYNSVLGAVDDSTAEERMRAYSTEKPYRIALSRDAVDMLNEHSYMHDNANRRIRQRLIDDGILIVTTHGVIMSEIGEYVSEILHLCGYLR